jgi:replication factor C small subunit
MSKYNNIWVERYRPKTLENLVLGEENLKYFSNLDEKTPHIFLWGNPGTGKTTLAKIIVNDKLKCQYLYINASDENGVDTIRNKVITFAQTKSFDGNIKVIILDEADGLTDEGQRILRNVMEEYSENVRFILTANYYNKIIEPLESRCLIFNLKPTLEDSYKRCLYILEKESIEVSDETKNQLKTFLQNRKLDLRRSINDLQRFSIDGTLKLNVSNNNSIHAQHILKSLLLKESVLDIRQYIISQEINFDSNYQIVMKELFDLIFSSKIQENKKKLLLLEIGEYMYRDMSVLDHEINFFCCLISLEKII